MIDTILNLYHSNAMFHGAVVGLGVAVGVDLRAFFAANGWKVDGWSFAVAAKHWLTGAVMGAGILSSIG